MKKLNLQILIFFMNFANNLDQDEAPQNIKPHLTSQFIYIQIIFQQNNLKETIFFSQILVIQHELLSTVNRGSVVSCLLRSTVLKRVQ